MRGSAAHRPNRRRFVLRIGIASVVVAVASLVLGLGMSAASPSSVPSNVPYALDVQLPQDISIDRDGLVDGGELVWRAGTTSFRRGPIAVEEPARLSIFDLEGNVLLRWGGADAAAPGNFVAPHGIWVDDEGSIYMAEVTNTIGVRPGIVPEGTR